MPSRLNTEFNYRTQVIGETPWEKINTIKGFLEGRHRAAALEECDAKKMQAKIAKLSYLKSTTNLKHEILELEAEILEWESVVDSKKEAYEQNRREIICLAGILRELYEIAEPTRIKGYDDEQMREANANNEFTVAIGKEILAEVIANGRPSPAKVRNAMSNHETWNKLVELGLLPDEVSLLTEKISPLKIDWKE